MPRPSRARCRAAAFRAWSATLRATPCSHRPSEPSTRSAVRSLYQHEECRLKGIRGIVRIVQDALADPQDHRTMTRDQGCKGQLSGLIPVRAEPPQKLAVRQTAVRPLGKKCTELALHD